MFLPASLLFFVVEHCSQLARKAVALLGAVLELLGQRRLLLLKRLVLLTQLRNLSRFIDSSPYGGGKQPPDNGLLQCGHGNGCAGGNDCCGGDGGSRKCGGGNGGGKS